jgi:hypothetical protein
LTPSRLDKTRWALARIAFTSYISLSVVTVVGGFVTAPLMTWYFFGDWRFWRHFRAGAAMFPHSIRLLGLIRKDSRGFMFSVPLTSPPHSSPDTDITKPHPEWQEGPSCGDCTNCCRPGGLVCPLLDEEKGLCRGYNSFYWRYFNCGRFPSMKPEIDYYDCRKWVVIPLEELQKAPKH